MALLAIAIVRGGRDEPVFECKYIVCFFDLDKQLRQALDVRRR